MRAHLCSLADIELGGWGTEDLSGPSEGSGPRSNASIALLLVRPHKCQKIFLTQFKVGINANTKI